ncbi:hypothetical protein [Streptomyces sp. NPDC088736]|uniref:hypothetical protein n=1 Tax=Streptomyces sp. NPDC088736 TaxID=3365881 RepID=UPI0037F662A1
MNHSIPEPDMRAQLETAFASIQSRREAKEAAQLAADSVATDNVNVLRERAERHAYHAVDEYWGHFNDIQNELGVRVIQPLLDTVARIAAERDALRARLHQAALAKVWTNEDGKKFVFADDLAAPLFGIEPKAGESR